MFAPVATGRVNAGRPAFARIEPDGTFELSTYREGDGAVVGDHWVSIVNGRPGATLAASSGPTTKANFKYIRFPRSTVAVVAGELNEIHIELTSRDIARYGNRDEPDD